MRAHEALLRRSTFAIAESLSRSEKLPAVSLREMQLAKLRRLVAHAAACCPYYRDLHLPSPDALRDLGDLSGIEPLTRQEMRRSAKRMCWWHAPGRLLVGRTHGTADEPLAFFWDRRRQAWDKANRVRAHRWHGLEPGDRELHLWPLDPPLSWPARWKQWLRERRDEVFGEAQIDSLHAFKERLPLAWRAWREFGPLRVTAYPSALTRLIMEGRRVGCHIGNPSLRCVFLTGEVTFQWQRKLIERELGVPTVQDYGVQEVGALAYACAYGRWHVTAESAIIEIIRDGRPAGPGEYGEIVATGLESLAMPVLRYCTGDIVKVPEEGAVIVAAAGATAALRSRSGSERCPCGRTLPVLPAVVGRATDFLESATGEWIEPANVVDSLSAVLEVGTFQVVQARDGSVKVCVAGGRDAERNFRGPGREKGLSHGPDHAGGRDKGSSQQPPPQPHGVAKPARIDREQAVQERISHLLGAPTRCTIAYVPALSRSLYGKCRYVSSDRTAHGLACR